MSNLITCPSCKNIPTDYVNSSIRYILKCLKCKLIVEIFHYSATSNIASHLFIISIDSNKRIIYNTMNGLHYSIDSSNITNEQIKSHDVIDQTSTSSIVNSLFLILKVIIDNEHLI